ncbi:huntingtin [Pieris brassicae]|uniref:huntingtin n=1 Tax=Pieris brassicae TaxID=7116 RepID=UPI001E66257E|nr:huntingtin [Pieris brassicae]
MNLLEKAEKSLEYLKNYEGVAKGHELQPAAGTLGRCLGALGARSNCARHYANLLSTAVPTLLSLASHESAEVRLVGDEALNRVIVGGFAFNAYKTNAILLNHIDVNKNARWNRAAINRICLGESWLRPGMGKIRSHAQALFPKLSQIIRSTTELQLVVEALESNLPRLLNALAEYSTDEEICDLSRSLVCRVECMEASVRRGISSCLGHLCAYRETLLTQILDKAFEKLWPMAVEDTIAISWFCVIKAVFQINDVNKFTESDLFTVQDYLELYQLCISYIEASTSHNAQNAVLECLYVLLGLPGPHRRGLTATRPVSVSLEQRNTRKGHRRNCSYTSAISFNVTQLPLEPRETEFALSGALQLGSVLRIGTPTSSIDDLNIQTPESPESEIDSEVDAEQLSRALSERFQRCDDTDDDDVASREHVNKINIGRSSEDPSVLYCARLITSRFLLAGSRGEFVSDRSVRVSVKSSALSCLSALLRLAPHLLTHYLDKDADLKLLNCSGSSEGTDSNQDNINEFILERNVCYQDSITESISQDLLKSSDSILTSKKDVKSLEKSLESELKSSKDVASNILDSKLVASGFSADTNMTISNFTSTTDEQSTGYPMTSSGVLSSSIDLDMKFDHFGDTEVKEETRKERVEESESKSEVIEYQHMSEVLLLSDHNDPQVRGLVRNCVGSYLVAALHVAQGDYTNWRSYTALPSDIADVLAVEKLVDLILKGLHDDMHSVVSATLSVLTNLAPSLCHSFGTALAEIGTVADNSYWLCRLNLVQFYEKLPYQRLFMLCPAYKRHSEAILNTLFRLLADQDQKVRNAAAKAIANITPIIHPKPRTTPVTMLTETSRQMSQLFCSDDRRLSLERVREMYFYQDLPEQMKSGDILKDKDTLIVMLADIMGRLMASNCKNYTQGLLSTLRDICQRWSPWHHSAYRGLGILAYCLARIECCPGIVPLHTTCLDICRLVYPAEIHDIMRDKSNRDIFETQEVKEKWQHLDNDRVASLSEKFLQVTLKMLNVLVHLIEEVNPNVHIHKSGIALPGSPVRRKTQELTPRKSSLSSDTVDDKGLKKKTHVPPNSLKANFVGHFYTEPVYMKLYDNLRATYSNHKINLDPKGSIFYDFLSTTLSSLAIQLELSTEVEIGPITEELLYYLKVIMPLCPENTVYCVTQLLKCLFGTNIINQYADYMSIANKEEKKEKSSFFDDVMLINNMSIESESRRSSVCSNISQKFLEKNPRIIRERELLIALENFNKNRMERKWGNNKKELERYIRLFEPVVIQALKTYTVASATGVWSSVLCLLGRLLALRVNYCMLDTDQLFIGFLMKQLELLEHHEIPNCCDLVKSIMLFLVQLSSSKHHTKQIIEIPKLIQLCDGLMASGAQDECIAGLEPVALKVFSNIGGSGIGTGGLGRAQQQEIQATREVLFYMLQKTMHLPKVLEVVSCVICLSQEQPENQYRWCELASDTLLHVLAERSAECEYAHALRSLESLLETISKDVLLEQTRVEMLLKILFKAPPEQATTPRKLKLRYLSIILVLLRKVLVLIPESEILLSINYLKATCIAPQSIFFNVKPNIDPLNVQNVNETCANLSPDVILVRFLFKTLTYAMIELDDVTSYEALSEHDELLYSVSVGLVVQVKHMLHLTNGCGFPLTAKSAQNLLHQEQSGLNTGLYSPDENIPLDDLNRRVLRARTALTMHWSHLLIRLNFLSHKYWQKLIGFSRSLPLSARAAHYAHAAHADATQLAVALAYCEYFVENGLGEVVHLSWLVGSRAHTLVSHCTEPLVAALLSALQRCSATSALLLHAIAARCQPCLQGEFALNTYKVLSSCHESQLGPLVFFICRIIGKLEPSIGARFSQLAIERCKDLRDMGEDGVKKQLSKEDVQVALELLQRDRAHQRYASLVSELNALASTVFDLSPLDLAQERIVNPQTIRTTTIDHQWLLLQAKTRCCQRDNSLPMVSRYNDLANLLSKLPLEDLTTIMSCPEFDRKMISVCFKVTCNTFVREFLSSLSVNELKETEEETVRQQREMARSKEEMTASVDSNKLNVNIHVFKKSDNKESKSQFFIPMTSIDNEVQESFGGLTITEEECEISVPELPKLYIASVSTLDKSLAEILRLFPKQNRPLSQSENFSLNKEQTIDRYTRRCHQVFQDKLFYQEFMTIQTILSGYLKSLDKIITVIDETDCDLLEKCIENLLPSSLSRNLAIFSVVSLQYLSFLISNKKVVEAPVNAEVSFRANLPTDNICVDNVLRLTTKNVAKALRFEEIWCELNTESNLNRVQSAICCLYAIVKYLVKDRKPLISKTHIHAEDGPKADIMITGNKLITLIEYWEENFYVKMEQLGKYEKVIECLIVRLARFEAVSTMSLIPPIAWASGEVKTRGPLELPLRALQDMDVLQPFLFRVNLIGWSSKKQFEEIWVGLVGALQGNGPHWAVRGISQLLVTAAPCVRGKGILHVPRVYLPWSDGMQRLRNILVGTSAYRIFDDINLERVPLQQDNIAGYQYAQFSTEYLKLASDLVDEAHYRVRREVKRKRKCTEIDVNSCVQLLMDVATDMLEPQAPTGLAARVSLLSAITNTSSVFSSANIWRRAGTQLSALHAAQWPHAASAALHALAHCLPVLHAASPDDTKQELTAVHEKLLKSLSASYAPLRQAALRGWLLQLPYAAASDTLPDLRQVVTRQLADPSRISVYEQSLYWAVLFSLAPDQSLLAANFLAANPHHYCAELVARGIISVLRRQVLPKDVKKTLVEKLLENMNKYSEEHAVQILLVHLFSADSKLLSSGRREVSDMDPDVLMSAMERITRLYTSLRHVSRPDVQSICGNALRHLLRETLPPAATLSRVLIELLDTCRMAEAIVPDPLSDRDVCVRAAIANCEVVFEVFQTSVSQSQLPVLSGWLFEALGQLVSGRVSLKLLPHVLLPLLVAASPLPLLRHTQSLALHVFHSGFNLQVKQDFGIFSDLFRSTNTMSYSERRLLCLVALHSQFTDQQLLRLRELCEDNEYLTDLRQCLLDVTS